MARRYHLQGELMSIRTAFLSISFLVFIAMAAMSLMLWQTSNKIADLGYQYADSKAIMNDMLMLRRHEKDFLLRKDEKYVERFNQRIASMRGNILALSKQLGYAPELQLALSESLNLLNNYHEKLTQLVELDRVIGFTGKEGLRAELNQAELDLHQGVMESQDKHALANILRVVLLENDFQSDYDLTVKSLVHQEITGAQNYFRQVNHNMIPKVEQFESVASKLTKALIDRGLDQNLGKRGELRQSIHEVEARMLEVSGNLSSTIESALARSQKQGVSMALVLTGLIAAVLLWQTFRLLQRLSVTNHKMHDISHGGGDLTKHLEVEGHDEVSELAHSVNEFIDTTAGLVREIKEKGEHVEEGAHHSLELNRRSMEAVEDQRNNTLAVNQAVHELVQSVSLIADSSVSVQNSINQADQEMQNGENLMSDASSQMTTLRKQIQENSELMNQLCESSNEIGNVTSVIRAITEQTNLLALNAAIEAARAGESGRGFAVVADEVRSLAQRTQASTVEIERMIQELQLKVRDSEAKMLESGEMSQVTSDKITSATQSIKENRVAMNEVRQMIEQIAGATEEQRHTVQNVEDATHNILVAAEQLLVDSSENCRNCESLEKDAHQMREDVEKFVV